MKFIKMLGLLAVAAAAMMAITATASATTLTSPTGTVYTGTITAVSEGATSLHGPFTTVTCQKSHVEGKVEKHGNGVTAGGKLSTLSFSECNFPVTVLKAGSLEIHPVTHTAPGVETTGTVTSSGAEITIQTSIANCLFTTSGTDVGTFTGTEDQKTATTTATLDINSAGIPRTGHSIFCGSSGTWTGSYEITTPDHLFLDATI
jgi:hypothetical protein